MQGLLAGKTWSRAARLLIVVACAAALAGPTAASTTDSYTLQLGVLTGPQGGDLRIQVVPAAGEPAVSTLRQVRVQVNGELVRAVKDVEAPGGVATLGIGQVPRGANVDVKVHFRGEDANKLEELRSASTALARPDLVVAAVYAPAQTLSTRAIDVVADISELNHDTGAKATVTLMLGPTPVAAAKTVTVPADGSLSVPFEDVELTTASSAELKVVIDGAEPFETDATNNAGTTTVEVTEHELVRSNVLVPSLGGYGAQFNQHVYASVTPAPPGSLPDLEAKVKALEPQLVRVFFHEVQERTPDQMESFIKTVELADESGASINVTYHTAANAKLQPDRFMGEFAAILDDLVRTRGFDNVRWVTIQNEPNTTIVTLAQYNALYRALDAHLRARGLREHIRLMGGDLVESSAVAGSNHRFWFDYMAENMNDVLDAYSVHIYWNYWDIPRMELRLRSVREIVTSELPEAARKPVFITEFGVRGIQNLPGLPAIQPGYWQDGTPLSRTNIVAFQHLWFELVSAQLGFSGAVKWDAYWGRYTAGYRETYNLIGPAEEGWPLYPAYHALRLLLQTTQRGWQVVQVAPWAEDDWRLFDDAGARIVDQPEKEIAAFSGQSGELTLAGLDSHGRDLNVVSAETSAYSIGDLPTNTTFNLGALERDRERRELARRHRHDRRCRCRPLRGAAARGVLADHGAGRLARSGGAGRRAPRTLRRLTFLRKPAYDIPVQAARLEAGRPGVPLFIQGEGSVARRIGISLSLLLAALTVALIGSSPAAAAIAPPWCGTPEPDSAENLPSTGTSFPHIPVYAIKCTLDDIQARSLDDRMSIEVAGQSATGRPLYKVVINQLKTGTQKQAYGRWTQLRQRMLTEPAWAQSQLALWGDNVKVPLFIQGSIHGNEYEGVDSNMRLIERLATTPYGTDPEVDKILDGAIVVFNVIQNPDGRVAGTRANGNGFDMNRDYLTQSQSEVKASVAIMQEYHPPETLDLHLSFTPTLVEATTKPHNPGIDYDLWLKWNQARIDANEAAMNAVNMGVTRPINDWCSDGSVSVQGGPCPDGQPAGPAVAESWDDWGPFYTPMYSQLVGLNGSTVEACMSTSTSSNPLNRCYLNADPDPTKNPVGRNAALLAHMTVSWSTLLYDSANRNELLHDQIEIYRRGVAGEARPACCPAPFDVENNWMHEFPTAYVIPVGAGQRSNAEANRLVSWLLANGIQVTRLRDDAVVLGQNVERGSYVVPMKQAHRGLAETSLGIGVDVSSRISILYAPPAAWSHGYLWGADILQVPNGVAFTAPTTQPISKPTIFAGGIETGNAEYYALPVNSATAVRMLNSVLGQGLTAKLALAPFTRPDGRTFPAGTVLFPFDHATKQTLGDAAREAGILLRRVHSTQLQLDDIDRSPRIAVFANALDQSIWSLRNLGFKADPVGTTLLNGNPAGPNPLDNYDVIFSTAGYPGNTAGNATARARLASFFAAGGGYIGGGSGGATFLTGGALVTGLTTGTRSGNGRSGIVFWNNEGGATSLITGAYPAQDTAIVDPPTWIATFPTGWSVDGRLPLAGFFAAGLWLIDAASASAPGAPMIVHGLTTSGASRATVFAANPLYRADPEREWPALASAAFWADK